MRTSTLAYRTTYRSRTHSFARVATNLISQAEYRVRMAHIAIAVCGALVILYVSNLYSIISTTVSLQRIQIETRALTTGVEELDGQYLKFSSTITPDTLELYGLTKGEVSFFIPRSKSSSRVALRAHEL